MTKHEFYSHLPTLVDERLILSDAEDADMYAILKKDRDG